MKNFNPKIDYQLIDRLRKNYFHDEEKIIQLKAGEYLLRKQSVNNRLFYIESGLVAGYLIDVFDSYHEIFRSEKNMIAGVQSFFSACHEVYADVVVLEDCVVRYIEIEDLHNSNKECFTDDFVPLIVHELALRQQFSKNVMLEKEETLKKLYKSDKLASLGQMAAGLAHELNNTSGVINGNISWLSREFSSYVREHESEQVMFYFDKGLHEGQKIPSNEVRKKRKELEEVYGLSTRVAKKIAKMNIEYSTVKSAIIEENICHHFKFWQMGVAMHDILIAAEHSSHILNSVKQLSAENYERTLVDINDSIQEALTLMKSKTASFSLHLKLNKLPKLFANKGELVQVWVNLIKNACESFNSDSYTNPTICIETNFTNEIFHVLIQDNGASIAPEMLDKIFQPNFTTKKDGLSFGLGLGLPIVQRIIDSYNGSIEVQSSKELTQFTVKIPINN